MPNSIPGQSQIGRVLAGQFRIDALLGQGGMGAVYKGVQLSVNRAVAIKLIAPSAPNQAELVKRFRREAEATARLSHPNTVRLFDFGVSDSNELYMVMELLDGGDLAKYLQDHGSLPLSAALRIVRQVLSALAEAHALGIVHRDLKPANLFLCKVHGGELFAKVMDFGIAGIEKAGEAQKLTMTGAVMGTPAYMSPEQAQGRPVDARSDLYSLGVILFEMLTGRLPFEADTVVSLLLAHVTQPPPRLSEVVSSFPQLGPTQDLLDWLLAKDPEHRPESALAALAAVDSLSAAAGSAPPPTAARARAIPQPIVTDTATPLGWTRTQQRRSILAGRRRSLALLMAAGVLVIGGAVAFRLRSGRPSQAAAVATVPTQDPSAVVHTVTIASAPKGASVMLDGAELGKTPYELQLRHDTVLTISLSGHQPRTITVKPDSDPNLVVELTPLHSVAVEPSKTPAKVERTAGEKSKLDDPPAPPETAVEARERERENARGSSAARPESPPPSAARPRGPLGRFVDNLLGRTEQRQRRDAMLNGAPAFPSIAAAQNAYRTGTIGADAYEDAVWVLKARREQRIRAEKENLRHGAITPEEYEWRLGRIDAEFRGD